ncbi:Alkylphosphonate utilization protein PhnM [Sulfitobacter noctilucicola]|uniref:Alpha-D-ribose 1-methylphosphonate 5-triphosphate diphosphatase n=1 Tax=Sulfitobacter noctilucicola TaxID=1342301 RepID=A0A7W6Q3D0_9RHOB|nr:alpha-D-ribose 1-methylphosphonate 5-triphosphate diphosphatase [Sulfitobacter noctilucicola]KIN62029.1 Alkylphosphonate utilization protein PhnM [Sulfitobacter noctilucicola]MBB4173453.1 alpha-D-ribose 1-methylphosphonate 5-triphosphate diphosphatase [Sulfitobacter noctilucicola]
MANLDLTGAKVLIGDGLQDVPLSFAEGVICEERIGHEVDLSGFLIMPGIVDMHGDGFERHLAQRRGAMMHMNEGLVACEAELAANGITTAVLAQFVSWEGGMRGLEFAQKVFTAIKETRTEVVTDLHPQLRFETHLLDLYADLSNMLEEWEVRYVVFNDHLPHDRLDAGKLPRRLNGQALKAGRSPENHLAFMQDLHAQSVDVPSALDWLCPRLLAAGVTMGSHDDATAEDRELWQSRGVTVAEFPETHEAAEAAHVGGSPILMGAPNVVRGGSHNANVSATDLISAGHCTALASDYHYPSPRRAALLLADSGICSLARAWGLISSGPAQVMGWTDRGTLEAGKRADITVLDAQTRRVAATFVQGRVSYMSGAIAERLLA